MKCKVKSGVIYFPTHDTACTFGRHLTIEFPEIKIVPCALGFALQTRKDGDYIGPNMRPSMENGAYSIKFEMIETK